MLSAARALTQDTTSSSNTVSVLLWNRHVPLTVLVQPDLQALRTDDPGLPGLLEGSDVAVVVLAEGLGHEHCDGHGWRGYVMLARDTALSLVLRSESRNGNGCGAACGIRAHPTR